MTNQQTKIKNLTKPSQNKINKQKSQQNQTGPTKVNIRSKGYNKIILFFCKNVRNLFHYFHCFSVKITKEKNYINQ